MLVRHHHHRHHHLHDRPFAPRSGGAVRLTCAFNFSKNMSCYALTRQSLTCACRRRRNVSGASCTSADATFLHMRTHTRTQHPPASQYMCECLRGRVRAHYMKTCLKFNPRVSERPCASQTIKLRSLANMQHSSSSRVAATSTGTAAAAVAPENIETSHTAQTQKRCRNKAGNLVFIPLMLLLMLALVLCEQCFV